MDRVRPSDAVVVQGLVDIERPASVDVAYAHVRASVHLSLALELVKHGCNGVGEHNTVYGYGLSGRVLHKDLHGCGRGSLGTGLGMDLGRHRRLRGEMVWSLDAVHVERR